MIGQSLSRLRERTFQERTESLVYACLARVSRRFLFMGNAARQSPPVAFLLMAVVAMGCAARPAAGSIAPGSEVLPKPGAPLVTAVPRTVVTPDGASSVEEIFAQARADFAERRFQEAARGFDRIVALDPEGAFAKESWLHGGAAHDELHDLDGAAVRYQEVARRYPGDPMAREALVRAVRVLTYLERWPPAGQAADALLANAGQLGSIELVVAYGGKALALVFGDDPDAASYFIEKGRDVIERERLDSAGTLPRDLAQLYFALGELRRIRGYRIHFNPVPVEFAEVLEQRCQLLLDAQSAYSDTMRAYDAHWSAMAGYRVGELYQKLHEELMHVPAPASATTPAKAQLFEGAMRLRYSVLLRKGLTMMEHTLSLSERTGERSEWVVRAREATGSIERSIRDEDAAIARLPYSRGELEKALEDLGRRKAR
jgi:tetratricopeptide (TPR) repeat protein